MKVRKKEKIRQCVGCRQEERVENLERFVRLDEVSHAPNELVCDPFGKLPGRGAYLHVERECVQQAFRSGFKRSYKGNMTLPTFSSFVKGMALSLKRRVLETIRASYRGGEAFVGETAVAEGLKKDQVSILFIASDAGKATAQKYRRNGERKKITVVEDMFEREELGQVIGKQALSLIGFRGKVAEKLLRDVLKYIKVENFETCSRDSERV